MGNIFKKTELQDVPMAVKENRVYFLLCEDIPDDLDVDYSTIVEWMQQDTLCNDAMRFIEIAEEKGRVVTVCGLIDGLNYEEISDQNFFFLTNKY